MMSQIYNSNRIVIPLTLDPRWVLANLAEDDWKFVWSRLVADDSRTTSAAMKAAARALAKATMLRKEEGKKLDEVELVEDGSQ